MIFPKTQEELELYIALQRIVKTDYLIRERVNISKEDKLGCEKVLSEAKQDFLNAVNKI